MTKRKLSTESNSADAPLKKYKDQHHVKNSSQTPAAVAENFRNGLFEEHQLQLQTESYARSSPYKHGVIHELTSDTLLNQVLEEVKTISFTEKETDIYKIWQSGDLANLDGLDDSVLKQLPGLLKLRNALYSAPFRTYLSKVTKAGALSAKKTDMAINIYKPGCHLLCHDDVIGSRRISYILYLTKEWKANWGGALRLYPTRVEHNEKGHKVHVPLPDHSVSIPPSWNQLSFFAVQPGQSYHDVEEVYAQGAHDDDTASDVKRTRIAISGWYHIPQEGEEGYAPGQEAKIAAASSRTQLKGNDKKFDFPESYQTPFPCYPGSVPIIIPESHKYFDQLSERFSLPRENSILKEEPEFQHELEPDEMEYLIKYINPRLLTPDAAEGLYHIFCNESAVTLEDFLKPEYADYLKLAINGEPQSLSSISKEAAKDTLWDVARPPHKQRYLYLPAHEGDPNQQNLLTVKKMLHSPVKELVTVFTSMIFRKWLACVTGLVVKSHDAKARRFRRGLDYQLGTEYKGEHARLEMTFGFSPDGLWESPAPKDDAEEEGDDVHLETPHGGEEVYLGGEDGDQDDEVLSSVDGDLEDVMSESSSSSEDETQARPKISGNQKKQPKLPTSNADDKLEKLDPAIYDSGEGQEELFRMAAGWNRLSIVLRDEGTMKFVRFVSKSAMADRWDITAEYGIDDEKTDLLELGYASSDDEDGAGEEVEEEDDDDDDEDDEDVEGNEPEE